MKEKITVIVETGRDQFGCFVAGGQPMKMTPVGTGKTAREAIADFHVCVEEMKEYLSEENEEFGDYEYSFIFDVGAFFSYHMINVTAFAAFAGLNASLLRQYTSGLKQPSEATIRKINTQIERYKAEISDSRLVDRPAVQYV